MRALVAAACGAAGLLAGPWLALLADRACTRPPSVDGVPDRRPLRGEGWRSPGMWPITATAVVVSAAIGARFGGDWAVPGFLIFVACLLVVSVTDLRQFLIPNRIIYPTLLAAAVLLPAAAALSDDWDALRHAAVGGFGAWAALLIVHLINPKGMAFGDVRLAAVIGVYTGWIGYGHVALALFLGFVAAAVVGGALIVTRRRGAKDPVPFGPFLAVGALAAVLFGNTILEWYRGG